MKNFRVFIAFAFLLACTPAFAQWQTPNHSVPIGRGAGFTGFGSAVPGTAGQPFVSQGPTVDPAFGTIGNAGFAAGPADTYKGSLNGTSVADVPRAPCTAANQALRYAAGVGESCGNIVVQTGFDMPVNLGLSVPTPSGGALVINLTQANGSAPTATSPVQIPFRSTVATTGTTVWSAITATQSITIPSGATLGVSNSTPFRVWIFEDYNSGSPELGVAVCGNASTTYGCSSWEYTLVTSIAMNSSATSSGVLYATAAATLDSVRIIGYCDFSSGLATAGSWTSGCTALQLMGPGIKKPGDTVRRVYVSTGAQVTAANSYTPSPTAPTNSNGSVAVSLGFVPSSPINTLRILANAQVACSGTNNVGAIWLSGGSTVLSVAGVTGVNSVQGTTVAYQSLTNGTVTYALYFGCAAASYLNAFGATAYFGGLGSTNMAVEEIMN